MVTFEPKEFNLSGDPEYAGNLAGVHGDANPGPVVFSPQSNHHDDDVSIGALDSAFGLVDENSHIIAPSSGPSSTQDLPTPKEDHFDAVPPSRLKAIPKPHRHPKKGEDGKYVCDRADCDDKNRSFDRKCEWSKHMDKHDRPYKCEAPDCAKMPGFTYSGGLLRHEREVHQKHGGPRKAFYCPYADCKRSAVKSFSRQENLTEHVRRCHKDPGSTSPAEIALDAPSDTSSGPSVGEKRKASGSSGLRSELKRSRSENEELSRKILAVESDRDAHKHSNIAMIEEISSLRRQISALQQRLGPGAEINTGSSTNGSGL